MQETCCSGSCPRLGSVGVIAIQFILTVIIAAIMYSHGEAASAGVIRFARRLGGNNGEEAAVLAAKTIRGVALGVVGTALIQLDPRPVSVWPSQECLPPAVLTAVMFILCIAQIGPGFVLIPAVIWLYYSGQASLGNGIAGVDYIRRHHR